MICYRCHAPLTTDPIARIPDQLKQYTESQIFNCNECGPSIDFYLKTLLDDRAEK